jgi:GntR family transcriptional regulator
MRRRPRDHPASARRSRAEGLIARYRAKGTFVRATPAGGLWCEVETDWNGLLRSRDRAAIEVLHEVRSVPADAFVAERGTAEGGTRAPAYRHWRRRHARDGQPFLLADVYLDERLADRATPEDLRTKTALRLVAGLPGVGIADARQTLTIGSADVEAAAALGVPLNAPVAHVHRTAVDSRGTLVLVADGTYRGDVVRVDFKLR